MLALRGVAGLGLLLVVGCSSDPGGIAKPDAMPPDATAMLCGNGVLDPGEMCDPGIAAGAPGSCERFCDDGVACTADAPAGPGCTPSCTHSTIANCCGNGILEAGEACDDGNNDDFDNCAHDCRFERALVLETWSIEPPGSGCDFDGDGRPDNALSAPMNDAARQYTSAYVTTQRLQGNDDLMLWYLVGDDPSMQDESWQTAFMLGVDMDPPANKSSDFAGSEPYWMGGYGLDAQGHTMRVAQGSTSGGMVLLQAPELFFPLPRADTYEPLNLARVTLTGTLTSQARPMHFTGRFCAIFTARSMHFLRNTSGSPGATYLDVFVLGLNFLNFRVTPSQPDMDVDGDGLERFLDSDNDGNIDTCIDGNGVQIVGIDCPLDPRIADGWSGAMDVEAVGALLAGRAP